MRAQHPEALDAVHEECLFDFPRALHHHLPDQVLGATLVRRAHGRDIEHPEKFTLRVEDRSRRAGEADKGRPKVVALVHRHRGAGGEYRGDAAGAFFAFRPAGAQVQAGLLAIVADRAFDPVVDGLTLGIGEQHAVVGIPHAAVEAGDFFAGDAQEQL